MTEHFSARKECPRYGFWTRPNFDIGRASEHRLMARSVDSSQKSHQIVSMKIEFTINRKTQELTYETGESLLDCALRNDLNPPYSCMEGVCTACLAQVQEGEVDFPDDTILDDSEVKQGRVLTCQAKPKADCTRLKVSFDAV